MCYDVCYEWYHTDHNSLENLNQFIDKFPKNLLQCMCVCLSIQYPRPKYAYEQVRGSKWRIRLFLYVLLLKFISKISSLLLILGENIPQSFFLYANNILFLIIFKFVIIFIIILMFYENYQQIRNKYSLIERKICINCFAKTTQKTKSDF